MKRIANCIVIALICAFILTSICYAHAGRTDSNGGHFDNSTGSYHYHHGYPAHQHYPDCPYDYDDQTNRNGSGSSSSSVASSLSHSEEESKWYNNGYKYGYDKGKVDGRYNGYKDGKADGYKEGQKAGYDEGYVTGYDEGFLQGQSKKEQELTEQFQEELHKNKLIFTAVIFSSCLLVWAFAANRYKKKYEETNRKLEEEKLAIKKDYEEKLCKILKAEEVNRKLPGDVSLEIFAFPVKGKITNAYPFGEYTVFVSDNGKRYHRRYGCGNATKPVHILSVYGRMDFCKVCAKGILVDDQTIRLYRQLQAGVILQKPEQNEYSKLRKPKGKQYSSFIDEYWHYNGSLFVKMKSGDTYRYYNVPVHIFEEMEKADSIGSFFNTRINGAYKYDILK